jgi:HD-GYP domain-containing protein (c-di-GMP phosphodiesterase class II)
MPPNYVLYATIGALLIAGMHAFIEYFLTTRAIQPVLASLQKFSKNVHRQPLSLEEDVLVSIRKKFLLSALFIGIFPVLLFSLATQVRLDEMHLEDYFPDFWNWAIIIFLVAAAFSSFGAFLLFRDIIQPINTLLKGMKNVKENQLVPAKELYGDEFSNVISGFNSMVQGLKERNETNRLPLESFYQTLSTALDARDPYTAGHSLRVSELLHPVLGANILEQVLPKEAMAQLIPGVRSHHERFDGYGYPDRLSGIEIPSLEEL